MLYAKIVLGLPVEGPFDYIVPQNLEARIKVGSRVKIDFRNQGVLGYIVKLMPETEIKNLKTILELIDDSPILDKNMLSLTKEVSDYYCCSWGEAIETALPSALRKAKRISSIERVEYSKPGDNKYGSEAILIHDLDGQSRWDIYLEEIKKALGNQRSTIILLPDIDSILKAEELIRIKLNYPLGILYRRQPQDLKEWLKVKEGKVKIIIGTRSGIFAPVSNLGLVIIDEEHVSSYKQDQVPHYHAREIAFMRINIEKAKLILGSASPSLESIYLAKRNIIKYQLLPRKRDFPEIKLIDMKFEQRSLKKRNTILTKYLEDAIAFSLHTKGKTLLFLNRKGFATLGICLHCGKILKCPRCNINLVHHFKDNMLSCRYCNFKMEPPNICPDCNSGYIRYSGIGTEKIESELSRLFPQARINIIDKLKNVDFIDTDIFSSTQYIIKKVNYNFDLIGILGIDNSLNRVDFRATEKTFALLVGLLGLTDKRIVIQTYLPTHYCFQALIKEDINLFYDEELKQRKQLNFPPFKHMALVKLRGKKESRVKQLSFSLFKKIEKYNKNKIIKIISVNAAQPEKLRDNFYWQILIQSNSAKEISKFLKKYLKGFSRSSIIVTVDVDPI